MPRYFIELGYKGGGYSGFQAQQNANTIQSEVEKALAIYFRGNFELTGSSRTDAGVHARQNYFHFDTEKLEHLDLTAVVYHLNAILPADIVIHRLIRVKDSAHCRFDAVSREYRYSVYQQKDPFLNDRSYYFPFPLDLGKLNKAANILLDTGDFESFSKRNTQVNHFRCVLTRSEWKWEGAELIYDVEGNRFLRGMVRGMVGTMLKLGRGRLNMEEFNHIIMAKDVAGADFSVPAHGLMLMRVNYPGNYFGD
jgi:tRNA pseudouridine38-40 synthase